MRQLGTLVLIIAVLASACAQGDDGPSAEPDLEAAEPAAAPTEQQASTVSTPPTPGGANGETPDGAGVDGAGVDGAGVVVGQADDEVQACADVIEATAAAEGDGMYRFSATVRSGDTGWEKYADAWEVRSLGGEVLGVRELAHPHETEQPFTRSLAAVEVPAGTTEVVVVARDSVNGFCGAEYRLSVPG